MLELSKAFALSKLNRLVDPEEQNFLGSLDLNKEFKWPKSVAELKDLGTNWFVSPVFVAPPERPLWSTRNNPGKQGLKEKIFQLLRKIIGKDGLDHNITGPLLYCILEWFQIGGVGQED